MPIQQLARIGNRSTCPVAILLKDNKVLLGYRHYTAATWKDISVWTSPGGRCEEGETLEQTLRREVREETGITDFQILDFIGEVPGAKEGDSVPLFYSETNQDCTLMEPEKFSEWRWVELADYLNGWPENRINDKGRKVVTEYLKKRFKLGILS